MPVNNSYESVITAKNPKVWFRFNETAGTPNNSGSLACTLTAIGNPQLNNDSSVDGRGINFALGSYYTLNNFPAFSLFDDRSFTVETWFKMPTRTDTTWPSLFSFGSPGYAAQFFFARLLGTNSNQVGRLDIGFKPANGYSEYKNYTSTRVDDNKWHHLVVTVNTTSMKTYIDGALSASATIATPASIDFDDSSTEKYFGTLGTFDEFAMYDYELSAAQVNANYVAGAYVFFGDIPGTASALMVQPAITTETRYDAPAMTASALAGDTRVSNFDKKTTLQGYLSTLSLEQNLTLLGDSIGPGGAYSKKFLASNTTPYQYSDVAALQDGSWSAGLWVNVGSGMSTDLFRFWYTPAASGGARTMIGMDGGNPIFRLYTSSGDNNYAYTSLDLRDNNWHYLAMRVNDKTVYYYVDGTQVFTDTFGGSRVHTDIGFSAFGYTPTGLANSTPIYISSFYVAPLNTVGATEISNIWTAGNNNLVQATTGMINPSLSFNNAFNDYVDLRGAEIDLRFNSTGTLVNNGAEGTAATISEFITDHTTKGVLTKNTKGYYFEDAYDWIDVIPYQFNDWNGTNTHSIYAKFEAPNESVSHNGTNTAFISGLNFSTNSFGAIVVGWTPSGVFLGKVAGDKYDPSQWSKVTVSDTSLLGTYHLYTVVEDGTTLRAYIDGKLVGTLTGQTQFPNYNQLTFNYTGFYGNYQVGPGFTVDELQIFDYPLSEQQIFEMYRSINIDGAEAASGALVMPTNIAGTGANPTISPMLANTGTFVMPGIITETNELAEHMEAFGVFVHPNYGANVNIDANYGHSAATADALFHMPGVSVGEINSVVHMEASALMGNVTVILPGNVQVNPGVALDATLVMPGIVTIKGARIFADYMLAKAFSPIPPAYFQLIDDVYYTRLYSQHSTIVEEPSRAQGSSLPNQPSTQVALSYLKFFNDVTLPITVGSNRFLTSEIPAYAFLRPEEYLYDNNGNIVIDDSKRQLKAGGITTSTPTPLLAPGYFDNQDRPAVRINNIEFAYPEDIYTSNRGYSLEFTVKTTKSNQVIAYGRRNSYQYYGYTMGSIGLFNGKVYAMTSFDVKNIHPITRGDNNYLLGNKNIADGQWHSVVVQWGFDGRSQIWIDGVIDRQVIEAYNQIGSGKGCEVRPYIMGSSSSNEILQADFETSVWSYDTQQFTSRDDIGLNYNAYLRYEPIKVEPMVASAIATDKNKGKGNRARALMLYFWSTRTVNSGNYAQRSGGLDISRSRYTVHDMGMDGGFDQDTFFPLTTWEVPNPLYDWDVFPIDVQGFYTSKVVKPESYKNPREVSFTGSYGEIPRYSEGLSDGFRDDIDDRRYVDLLNDIIDIDSYDAIFFRNYPDQKSEIDSYGRSEVVDEYFGIRENVIFDKFLAGLRRAVDSGMSLYITNPQLAIDLGIVDRVEVVSDLDDNLNSEYGDDQSRRRVSRDANLASYPNGRFSDEYKNNRHRVINTLTGLTDEPSYILTERANFTNDDARDFGGTDRRWRHIEYKPNGLTIGDEMIFETRSGMLATPIANVKAGRAITTFATSFRNGEVLLDNPYRNYATTIAVKPGDVLNGTQVGGKIFVNFTELIQDMNEEIVTELKSDYWIDKAVADGTLDAETAADYKADTKNIDRQLAAGDIDQAEYNYETYWTLNGENFVGGAVPYGSAGVKLTIYSTSAGTVRTSRKAITSRGRRRGKDTGTANDMSQSYRAEWGYVYPVMEVRALNMLSRGFIWLSDRESYDTVPQRPLATLADATMIHPTIVADRDLVTNAQAMVANATTPEIGNVPDRRLVSLPMLAESKFTDVTKAYYPEPYTTTAFMPPNVRVSTYDTDQVVLYVMHEDAIIYLREDVIK